MGCPPPDLGITHALGIADANNLQKDMPSPAEVGTKVPPKCCYRLNTVSYDIPAEERLKMRKRTKLLSSALSMMVALPMAAIVVASPAQAASCTYSNLTSMSVKNLTCKSGAYAAWNGSKWNQAGDWAAKGKYSYNWTAICYSKYGMIGTL